MCRDAIRCNAGGKENRESEKLGELSVWSRVKWKGGRQGGRSALTVALLSEEGSAKPWEAIKPKSVIRGVPYLWSSVSPSEFRLWRAQALAGSSRWWGCDSQMMSAKACEELLLAATWTGGRAGKQAAKLPHAEHWCSLVFKTVVHLCTWVC